MATSPATVHFIGVRHHSPACARIVRETIDQLRPDWVLIEGPVDMNDRLDELLLGHELPIALYSYVNGEGTHFGSWTPFCDYSPEWQALTVGQSVGAQVRFIDLPAWHWAFASRQNRFSDGEIRYQRAVDQLCQQFRIDGLDALWDHLFEQPEPVSQTAERMAVYFDELRTADDDVAEFDAAREAYMAEWVAAAASTGERVLVVTGGFHTAAIRELATLVVNPEFPEVPQAQGAVRNGSYIVPFSNKRLDSFVGYQSGMPSPAWYDLLWTADHETAGNVMLDRIVEVLREKNQAVSAADLISARAMTEGLARLRNHPTPLRCDILDGLASALLKESQEFPLPWTTRGVLQAGTDPIVVEITKTLSGDKHGRLHPATPMPPLVADAHHQLTHPVLFGVTDDSSKGVELDLIDALHLEASRILHRLRVLAVPGIERVGGGSTVGGIELHESWAVSRGDAQLPALIEAAAYGATVEAAAASKVASQLGQAVGDPEALAQVLAQAVLIDIGQLTDDVLAAVQSAVRACHDVRSLGSLLATAVGLYRYDTVLKSAGDATLAGVISSTFERAAWLFDAMSGNDEPHRTTAAILAMKDALRCEVEPPLDRTNAVGVMQRLSLNPTVGHETRGAAFGFRWAIDTSNPIGRDEAAAAFARSNRVDTIGDWLAGLFALAREDVVGDDLADRHGDVPGEKLSLISLIDEAIGAMSDDGFLIALPSLRMAFSWFPPREREQLAERVLARYGLVGADAELQPLANDPLTIAAGRALDAQVDDLLDRFGLEQS